MNKLHIDMEVALRLFDCIVACCVMSSNDGRATVACGGIPAIERSSGTRTS